MNMQVLVCIICLGKLVAREAYQALGELFVEALKLAVHPAQGPLQSNAGMWCRPLQLSLLPIRLPDPRTALCYHPS